MTELAPAAHPPFERIEVVVPAHNEAELLPDCLAALAAAARFAEIPVGVSVVLDDCTDGTELVIGEAVRRLWVSHRNVGAARAAGFDSVSPHGRVWFATTDADSRVPEQWLARQLTLGSRHDAVVGTVGVDWRHYPPLHQHHYERAYRHRPGRRHDHVHGANLGMTAEIYRRVGGFRDLSCGEDVDLVSRLAAAGARIAWDADNPVITSDRVDSRAGNGFAGYLAELAPTGSDM